MDTIREYAISIIAVSLMCSIAYGILQTPVLKSLTKMICGMILTITIAAPLWNLDLSFPASVSEKLTTGASNAAQEGAEAARTAWEAYITREAQTYIQNKAAELNADISVEIGLRRGDPPVPECAVISGRVTPYVKLQLQNILQTEMGIAKENLEWIG